MKKWSEHGRRRANAGSAVKNEINVTPLVDVVLVLLIIFMVVTPMLHRGVQIALPETSHHRKKQDTGEQFVVTVREDGTYIETVKVTPEELSQVLLRELTNRKRPVHVRADKSLKYAAVRKVLERVHEAGALDVGLASEEKK